MAAIAALLTLADSRLPVGGHAHSGGVEQAIKAGVLTDAASLADFLDRRLRTAGPVAAAFAAAACHAASGRDVTDAALTPTTGDFGQNRHGGELVPGEVGPVPGGFRENRQGGELVPGEVASVPGGSVKTATGVRSRLAAR